jgi:hypothetical protein
MKVTKIDGAQLVYALKLANGVRNEFAHPAWRLIRSVFRYLVRNFP